MPLKAAFVFLAPDVDPEKHRKVVITPAVELTVVATKDYKEAAEVSRKLVDGGVQAIELCGGFGHIGVAEIVKAVKGKVPVGVVRFDSHPGLEFKSGDELFRSK